MTTRYMATLLASSFLTAFSATTTLWAAEPASSFPSKEIRFVVPWNEAALTTLLHAPWRSLRPSKACALLLKTCLVPLAQLA